MSKLNGKVAIITGAASGIGRMVALLFAKEGARVVVADIDTKGGDETVNMIKKAGGEATFIYVDVTKSESVRKMVNKTIEIYKALHILVNCAGIEGSPLAKVHEYPEDLFDKVINVNLKGVFLAMKYAIPEIIRSGGGSIVNVSSILGQKGMEDCAYSASKAGVILLTRVAAFEYAKYNIRVNAVAPGAIETPMGDRILKEKNKLEKMGVKSVRLEIPMGRRGKPEEVARTILFLASEESSYITGTVVNVDGGMCLP
ncbi:MAG: SDR family NAD(P)-dependent oxidoreductase [Candidatus Bathyarchaeia archaeon]